MNVSTRRDCTIFSNFFWDVSRSKSGKKEEVEVPKSPETEDVEGIAF